MFSLSEEAELRIEENNKFGIKDKRLKYIYEIVKIMYMEDEKDVNGKVIINPETGRPNQVPMRRKSGRLACTHPYEVAYDIWKMGYPLKYTVTALLHDVMEDTKYEKKDIKKILIAFEKRYPDAIGPVTPESFNKEVLDALDRLTKKSDFGRPREPNNPPLRDKKGELITLNDMMRGMYWRSVREPEPRVNRVKIHMWDMEFPQGWVTWVKKKIEFIIYDIKMRRYINSIAKSHVAKIVKIIDRKNNLNDYKKGVTSAWIEKYSRDTVKYFLDLLDDTVPEDIKESFMFNLQNARFTRTVLKEAEKCRVKGGGGVASVAAPPAIYSQYYPKKSSGLNKGEFLEEAR